MTLVPPLLSVVNWGLVGLTGGAFFVEGNSVILWAGRIAATILGVLIILVAPYRLWKTASDDLTTLKTPRLEVKVEPPEYTGQGTLWRHVRVTNPTGRAIAGCYAQLKSFRAITDVPKGTTLPRSGINYPLATRHGERRITTQIGSGGFKLFDIIACGGGIFETPTLARDGWLRDAQFPLGQGTYEAEIQVGSEVEDFPPMCKKFKIVFSGGIDLEIEELKEANSGIIQ